MSESQQPTLDDFQAENRDPEWERVLNGTGALYGRRDGQVEHARTPADAGTCQTCGIEVEKPIQRTMGDEHGRVPACEHCASNHYGHDFQTTTSAVIAYRTGKIGREVTADE